MKINRLQYFLLVIYKLSIDIYKCRVQSFVLNTVFQLVLASENYIIISYEKNYYSVVSYL